MDRSSTRAWRRIQKKRVWHNRLRILFVSCGSLSFKDPATGVVHDPKTWKDLRKEHWCQKYRTMSTTCSCYLCSSEKYDRLRHKRDTRRDILLDLEE